MNSQDETLNQINRSGFPFQLRVEDEIQRTQTQHRWIVASSEHPWTNSSASGFIDIVLEHEQYNRLRLVIECKRIKANDARQLRWVFLMPMRGTEGGDPTQVASAFQIEVYGKDWPQNRAVDFEAKNAVWAEGRVWADVMLSPESLQSQFCVLAGDEPRRQPILEGLAREVLQSAEGLADEEVTMAKSQGTRTHVKRFIFPAIITNAELAICRFEPGAVNLSDGSLIVSDVNLDSVPFIRFRKSLATDVPQGTFNQLREMNRARERTVFIVNAAHIPDFLQGWGMFLYGDRFPVELALK